MKQWIQIVFVGLLLCVLSACTDYKDNTLAPAPLKSFKPELVILKNWDTTVGEGSGTYSWLVDVSGRHYFRLGGSIALDLGLAQDAQHIYAADKNGLLEAIDYDGHVKWKTTLSGHPSIGPGAGETQVYLAMMTGDLFAVNKATGHVAWKKSLNLNIVTPPVAARGKVIVHAKGGVVLALDEKTGKQLWRYDASFVPPLTVDGSSQPVIVGDRVVFGLGSGQLVALNVDSGRLLWQDALGIPSGGTAVARLASVVAAPVVSNGVVYAGSIANKVAAYDLSTGHQRWYGEHGVSAGLAVTSQNLLVFVTPQGAIWGLDAQTGSPQWVNSNLLARQVTAPAVSEGAILVGDYQGFVHWLSPKNGDIIGRIRLSNERITGPVLVHGKNAYAMAGDGKLTSFHAVQLQ